MADVRPIEIAQANLVCHETLWMLLRWERLSAVGFLKDCRLRQKKDSLWPNFAIFRISAEVAFSLKTDFASR